MKMPGFTEYTTTKLLDKYTRYKFEARPNKFKNEIFKLILPNIIKYIFSGCCSIIILYYYV